jgi:Double-GTPase 1
MITICGLPASGKTTFLAALWHLISTREVTTTLKFETLRDGNFAHLNAIAKRWQEAREQIHTEALKETLVSMSLKDANDNKVGLTFPDMSGESFQQMWEERECDAKLADILRSGEAIILFLHADKIVRPLSVVDATAQSRGLGGANREVKPESWHPKHAPTQVQLVDMLQLLRSPSLKMSAEKLVVILSAWDMVEEEGRTPTAFLSENLPLLDQYLRSGADGWEFRIYGLSAQGGQYQPNRPSTAISPEVQAKIDAMREISDASTRIRLVSSVTTHDLTEPLAWLMQ